MLYIPPMPTFRHGDATIYYEEFGRGFPILTFAPAGLQSTIEVWSRPARDGWHTYTADHLALLDHLRIDRCHLYGQCIGGSFILSLLKARPARVASAVLAQPIGRVGPMSAVRTPRFQAWAETLTDHPEATPAILDALSRNLYEPGFVYCVDRAFVSACATPCLVLAGNDEAHPLPISEELAQLLPTCELVREWKTEPALTSARKQVADFLAKHTPRGS